jgi:hypothetical protein
MREQDGVNDGKNRRIRPNTKSQSNDRDDGESGTLTQLAQRVTNILK